MLLVIMAITRTNFNIAVGFGLFALLSMVKLRSAPFTKAEMAYLFGGVTLAVINGAGIPDLAFVLTCNFVIILSAAIISSWSIEHSASVVNVDNIKKMTVVLDQIDETAIKNHNIMKRNLAERFNLDVLSFEFKSIDYVKDVMELRIVYQLSDEEISLTSSKEKPQSFERAIPASPSMTAGQ
jgi:hypothetical protein